MILWIIKFYSPAHFVWQIKIMWKMLKCRPRNGQTYEQIRKIITIVQPRKKSISRKIGEKLAFDTRLKQSKDNDLVCKSFRNLTPLEQENKMLEGQEKKVMGY